MVRFRSIDRRGHFHTARKLDRHSRQNDQQVADVLHEMANAKRWRDLV
jgi:hypothetical protein